MEGGFVLPALGRTNYLLMGMDHRGEQIRIYFGLSSFRCKFRF